MGVAVGLVLIAFGAILIWAVNATVTGIDVNAVGVILLVLGIVIFFFDLLWWRSWAGGPWRRTVYAEGPAPAARPYGWWPGRRRAVVEEDVPAAGAPPGPPPP
jgi:hypothetical protein